MILTILGRPMTKKNHGHIVTLPGRMPIMVPSSEYKKWAKEAVRQLRVQWQHEPIEHELSMCAVVYRDRRVGDLGNYLAAICDALQPTFVKKDGLKTCTWTGVVVDDKLIGSFDGSRLAHDKDNPRVEIQLTTLEAADRRFAASSAVL